VFLKRSIKFFASLRLTVALLALAMVLVFAGTLAEVHLGLYTAQAEFFRSFLIYWHPENSGWNIPVFPGGYFLGLLLLINLIAAHVTRFKFSRGKIGIWLIHAGLILLIAGQLFTDLFTVESRMHLRIGETKDYSESDRVRELAIMEATDKKSAASVAIPERLLVKKNDIQPAYLPFIIRVKEFYANSLLSTNAAPGFRHVNATDGYGAGIWWKQEPRETAANRRDLASALVEIVSPQGLIGAWLVSDWFEQPQTLMCNGRAYKLQLRPERLYQPFSLHLLAFTHEVYPGTDIPKNYSSRLRLQRPDTGENREVRIYMNNPLRYGGKTFYQAGFDADNQGTVLRVVKNPGWFTPYFACGLVTAGMVVQFLSHLILFLRRRVA
jgi:ResB-like family